jgi:predicted DNA-binding protein (MmcQ/YjbR family)
MPGESVPRSDPHAVGLRSLRDFAMRYPHATEDHPWGETAIKIRGRVFVFLSRHDGKFNVSLKLPVSAPAALGMPFAEPTGYGLGKHGWVTASFEKGDAIPVDLIREWIDESFRAVAPRSVVTALERAEEELKPAPARRPSRGRRVR